MNLEGITHDESLVSLNGTNCINWILGHILISRDEVFAILGLKGMCDEKMKEIYKRGIKNFDIHNAIDLNVLLEMFKDSQKMLDEKLKNYTDKEIYGNLLRFAFHESYHSGQLGILRRLIGKKGAIE
ncbi:MAG: hypothetical protein N2510_02880 [Ignavibacteria bacterium]|nr:hypothetical protein [Ignavibacteria bacterium]